MPRPPPDLTQPVPYAPGPPPAPGSSPEEVKRAIWAEFELIALALGTNAVAAGRIADRSRRPL